MSDDEIPVLFTETVPGPQLTAKDLARALSKGGVPHSAASARVASYAKNRWVHVREKKGDSPNSPNVFSVMDVFAAKALSALHDAGIGDHDVMQRASTALYAWNLGHFPGGEPPAGLTGAPIAHAIAGTLNRGEDWSFRLDFWRNPQTEERYVNAWLSSDNTGRRWSGYTPDWIPLATVIVPLEPHFLPLSYLLGTSTEAN